MHKTVDKYVLKHYTYNSLDHLAKFWLFETLQGAPSNHLTLERWKRHGEGLDGKGSERMGSSCRKFDRLGLDCFQTGPGRSLVGAKLD